jgi:protein-tyrosine phosphatase
MKILMVCLGNICRSPLAHGIMEKLVEENKLDWQVDSAGTGDWHIGKAPDHRSISIAHKYGIDISAQVCRQFQQQDFEEYDRIYVMDQMNLEDVSQLAITQQDKEKIRLLLDQEVVPDPYWDDNQFDPVFKMIKKGCEKIIEAEIKKRPLICK